MLARRQLLLILLALAAAAVLVVALLLWLKPEWLPGGQAKPDFSAYLRVEEPRETLMDVYRSYESEPQVTRQLSAAGLQWTAERLHVEGTRKYPTYKIDTLTVRGYRHLDYPGTLSLEFFNDRLSTLVFRPDDPQSYSKRLRQTGVIMERQSLSTWQRQVGNLRISTNHIYAGSDVGKTLNTVPFFSWEDIRLTAQAREWYDVYGSKTMVSPVRKQSSDGSR